MRLHILDTPDYYKEGYQFGLPVIYQEPEKWYDDVIDKMADVIEMEAATYNSINLIGIGASGVALMTMLKPCFLTCNNILIRRSFERSGHSDKDLDKLYQEEALNIIVDDHVVTGRTLNDIASYIDMWSDKKKKGLKASVLIKGIVTLGMNVYSIVDSGPENTVQENMGLYACKYPNMEFFTQARHMMNTIMK
jgi:hypothetical protein